MKKYLAAFAVMMAMGIAPTTALAGDAIICYGPIETTPNSTTGTVNYPQVTNATKFTCRTTVGYTLAQLAQLGWTIGQMVPVMHSMTYSSTGATQRTRQQLIIHRK